MNRKYIISIDWIKFKNNSNNQFPYWKYLSFSHPTYEIESEDTISTDYKLINQR